MFQVKILIILYALNFWEIECTPKSWSVIPALAGVHGPEYILSMYNAL